LAVTGVRRCGKSIFSYMMAKGCLFGYANFDDERLACMRSEDLNGIMEAFYGLYGDVEYVILDEIQNVEKWELFANRLRRTKKVIITGSSSKLLTGELATHLTGRYIDIALFPFSFREFLLLKGLEPPAVYTTREKAEIMNLLTEYMTLGGFPEVQKFGKALLVRIYEDILTKDIVLRHGIKKVAALRGLSKYLVSNVGGEISYSRLSHILDVRHVSTISNWVSYLQEAFMIIKVERFDFKLRQQFLAPKKVYCIDNGIVAAIGFKFSENVGKIMENTVAVELRRRAAAGASEVYYWKDHQQHEVDFVVKTGPCVTRLLQATYASARHEVQEREIKALLKASRQLRCNDLQVITWDYEGEESVDGRLVRFTPLWRWLLEREDE
jgi:predicted AAA+ superfamily ATPase